MWLNGATCTQECKRNLPSTSSYALLFLAGGSVVYCYVLLNFLRHQRQTDGHRLYRSSNLNTFLLDWESAIHATRYMNPFSVWARLYSAHPAAPSTRFLSSQPSS